MGPMEMGALPTATVCGFETQGVPEAEAADPFESALTSASWSMAIPFGGDLGLAGVRKADGTRVVVKQPPVTAAFGETPGYAYNDGPAGMNWLTSATDGSVTTAFSYGGNGNFRSRSPASPTNAPVRCHDWTPGGFLAAIRDVTQNCDTETGAQLQNYAYDGLGQRVKVEGSDSKTWTVLIYSGQDVIFEVCSDGGWTKYVYAAGLRIARIDCPAGQACTTVYYLADHLGSTRKVLDESGGVLASFDYDPFGKPIPTPPTATEPNRYTGEKQDPTGFVYLRARQYDPDIGRFVSLDSVLGSLSVPQTLNRYAYVVNNPLRYVDPSGMSHDVPLWANLLTLGLAEEVPHTIDWWNQASDAERWGFIAGIATAVAIGVLVGVSCVVAACAGLVLLGASLAVPFAAGLAAVGSYAGVTTLLGGSPSREGAGHVFFWGSLAGALGFAGGQIGGTVYHNRVTLPRLGSARGPPYPGQQLPAEANRIGWRSGSWYSSRPFGSVRALESELGPIYRPYLRSLWRITGRTSGAEAFSVGDVSASGVYQYAFRSVLPRAATSSLHSFSPTVASAISFAAVDVVFYVF